MPELPFVQVMAVAGLIAILAVGLAMLAGARLGTKAGLVLLRASLIGITLAIAGAFAWGSASGDLGRFNARVGASAWFQMGAFFGIVYGTGYRFVSVYLADKHKEGAKEAADA